MLQSCPIFGHYDTILSSTNYTLRNSAAGLRNNYTHTHIQNPHNALSRLMIFVLGHIELSWDTRSPQAKG